VISVRKRNQHGQVSWEYSGQVLKKGDDSITLEARFNRDDMPFQGILLKRDDRFVETFYTQHWYNIFEIHDRDDERIKGWYCNIGRPMVWDDPQVISYVDLYLDLWVTPDGAQTVLDEDEFEQAVIDDQTRAQALQALQELKSVFNAKQPG
jgi:predicted RNA-binding protein associated with RNAse of E/G family